MFAGVGSTLQCATIRVNLKCVVQEKSQKLVLISLSFLPLKFLHSCQFIHDGLVLQLEVYSVQFVWMMPN